VDEIYQSKGLDNVLLMQYAALECDRYLSSNGAMSTVSLLDETLVKTEGFQTS